MWDDTSDSNHTRDPHLSHSNSLSRCPGNISSECSFSFLNFGCITHIWVFITYFSLCLRVAMETYLIPFIIQTYDAHIQYLHCITKGDICTLRRSSTKSSALIMLSTSPTTKQNFQSQIFEHFWLLKIFRSQCVYVHVCAHACAYICLCECTYVPVHACMNACGGHRTTLGYSQVLLRHRLSLAWSVLDRFGCGSSDPWGFVYFHTPQFSDYKHAPVGMVVGF